MGFVSGLRRFFAKLFKLFRLALSRRLNALTHRGIELPGSILNIRSNIWEAVFMDALSADEVRHVAKLANLYLTDEEVEKYRHQLTGILQHVQSLQAIDCTGVEATGHATASTTVLRKDEPGNPLEQEQVTANAPETSGEFIRVKAVMD